MKIVNVLGFEGEYCVTDEGKVYNLKTGNEMQKREYRGYYYVHLHSNGLSYNLRLNRLVLSSFRREKIDEKFVVDHIDCNKLNDRLDNLRLITNGENTLRGKTSKYSRGVCYYNHNKKFGANIQINHKRYFLGLFDTEKEASEVYEQALSNWKDCDIVPLEANERVDKTHKICKMCGEDLPIEEFKELKRGGHSHLCMRCEKEYKHEKYLAFRTLKEDKK